MVKEGIPFVLVPLFIALGFGLFLFWIPVAIFVAVALFMAYFFRDPKRTTQTNSAIEASADTLRRSLARSRELDPSASSLW